MEVKREVEIGKIINYDGYNGTIQGLDQNNYLLKNTDIIEKEELKEGEHVIFDKEIIQNAEIGEQRVARFVKRYTKQNLITRQ